MKKAFLKIGKAALILLAALVFGGAAAFAMEWIALGDAQAALDWCRGALAPFCLTAMFYGGAALFLALLPGRLWIGTLGVSAVAVGLSILGLWCVRFGGALTLESGLVFVGILAVTAAALWLKKSGGTVKYGERELQFLSKNASYPVVLVSCLASLLALAAAMALGSFVAYYLIFLMVAWLFALLVYYTVKLM